MLYAAVYVMAIGMLLISILGLFEFYLLYFSKFLQSNIFVIWKSQDLAQNLPYSSSL